MLSDISVDVRRQAVQRVLQAREIMKKQPTSIRQFKVLKIRFNAKAYTEIIHWETEFVTEPHLLRNMTGNSICIRNLSYYNLRYFRR